MGKTLALVGVLILGSASVAVAQEFQHLTKVQQSDGTWRLWDARTGEAVGRVWNTAHADRLLRDGSLAEEIVAVVLPLSGTARRQAARAAFDKWVIAGGHSVDFSALTFSTLGTGGTPTSNLQMYIAGADLGYLHGVVTARDLRIARIVRLAEELWSAEQAPVGTRNASLDAALDRFRDDGGVN